MSAILHRRFNTARARDLTFTNEKRWEGNSPLIKRDGRCFSVLCFLPVLEAVVSDVLTLPSLWHRVWGMRQLSKCLTVLQEWPSCTPELTPVGSVTLNFLSHEEMEQGYHFSSKWSGILLLAVESIVAIDPMPNTDYFFFLKSLPSALKPDVSIAVVQFPHGRLTEEF